MGLDLTCGPNSIKVGSYGYVQVQRWALLQANELYYQQNYPTQYTKEMWERTKIGEMKYGKSPILDYVHMEKVLKPFLLEGVFDFCYQSDCEGYYSVDKCQTILDAFQTLKPFMNKISQLEMEMENGQYYLEPIFKYAVQHKEIIELC